MPKPDVTWTGSWVKTFDRDGTFAGWKWVVERKKV